MKEKPWKWTSQYSESAGLESVSFTSSCHPWSSPVWHLSMKSATRRQNGSLTWDWVLRCLFCISFQGGSYGHPQPVCRAAGTCPHVFSPDSRRTVLQLGWVLRSLGNHLCSWKCSPNVLCVSQEEEEEEEAVQLYQETTSWAKIRSVFTPHHHLHHQSAVCSHTQIEHFHYFCLYVHMKRFVSQ